VERLVHPYPHLYVASAVGQPAGSITVTSPRLAEIATAPPAEFDGPGDVWSPETLFVASIADCFVLTFRALASASRFEWKGLSCRVEGVLDRADGGARFTAYTTHARLEIPQAGDAAKARTLLEKAEQKCLVANSLLGTRALVAEVVHAT
jgi:organic hydroperoxide reductase OsmC/OhrA